MPSPVIVAAAQVSPGDSSTTRSADASPTRIVAYECCSLASPAAREQVERDDLVEAARRVVDPDDDLGHPSWFCPSTTLSSRTSHGYCSAPAPCRLRRSVELPLSRSAGPLVGRAVEGHRHLEPGLLARLLERRQRRAELRVVDVEHHLVQPVGGEEPGAARGGGHRGCRAAGIRGAAQGGAGRPVTPAGGGDGRAHGDEGAEPAEEEDPAARRPGVLEVSSSAQWTGRPRVPTVIALSPGCERATRRQTAAAPASWCSTWSTESTCWITIVAAPMTPGLAPGAGRDDLQLAGGQREGAPVDDLADAGQQALGRLGQQAADRDDRRVEQAHAGRQHVPDLAAGLAHGRGRREVARLGQLRSARGCRRRRFPSRATLARWPARWRPPRGSRRCRRCTGCRHRAGPRRGRGRRPRPGRRGAAARR